MHQLAVLLLFALSSSTLACLYGYSQLSSGQCVKYFSTPELFFIAEQTCFRDGGHLISIHNAQTNAAVHDYALDRGSAEVMIGLQAFAGFHSWSDNSPFDFSNFAPQNPNGDHGVCVALQLDNGQWRSVQCDSTNLSFICHIEGPATAATTIPPLTITSSTTTPCNPTILADIVVLFDYTTDFGSLTGSHSIENFISQVLFAYPGNHYRLAPDATGNYSARLNVVPYPDTNSFADITSNPIESLEDLELAMLQVNIDQPNPAFQARIAEGLQFVRDNISKRDGVQGAIILISKSDEFVDEAIGQAIALWESFMIYTIGVGGADLTVLASDEWTTFTAGSPQDDDGLRAAAVAIGDQLYRHATTC